MTPFAYTDEQRSRIVQCLSSVSENNPDLVSLTWTGKGFRLTKAETAERFRVGEKYELQTAEELFSTAVDDLELYARCYEADIARECDVSKKQLENVAALCAELTNVLLSFRPYPHLLGLGVEREQRTVDGKLHFIWELDGSEFFMKGVDYNKGKDELLALVEKLRSIEGAVSKGIFLVGPSASKRWRNEYLRKVLQAWLGAGGVVGGPKSTMISFFREVCIPVLGKNFPTEGALVKLAYALKDDVRGGVKGCKKTLKQLKISKIGH
jgi:hypothetical protein